MAPCSGKRWMKSTLECATVGLLQDRACPMRHSHMHWCCPPPRSPVLAIWCNSRPDTPCSDLKNARAGMTYEEVAERMPEEYAARKQDKLNYRCGFVFWGGGRGGLCGLCACLPRPQEGAAVVVARARWGKAGWAPGGRRALLCLILNPFVAAAWLTCPPLRPPLRRYPSGESYQDLIQVRKRSGPGFAAGRGPPPNCFLVHHLFPVRMR